ncbi:unnamed protein product [Spirodela intermedia]|uniref:Uncharacterized protein n=1 Tax=Spirodela intermedia TaxID=51605 RepID=A0ABN7EBL4_SPIIN|nr:unnamed protein product [Spirodela intermedia]
MEQPPSPCLLIWSSPMFTYPCGSQVSYVMRMIGM